MSALRLAALALAVATTAGAATFDESFAKLRDKTVSARAAVFEDLHRRWSTASVTSSSLVARSPALSPATATNVVARAQAAIQTAPDGTDAGFTLAPLLLAGITSDHQLTFSLGAFKDGKTLLGAAWTYQGVGGIGTRGVTFKDLGLEECELTKGKLRNQIDELKESFRVACSAFALTKEPTAAMKDQKANELAREQRRWKGARDYCADPSLAQDFAVAVKVVTTALADARTRTDAGGPDAAGPEFVTRQGSVEVNAAVSRLAGFSLEHPAGCLDDESIQAALTQFNFRKPRHKVGVSAQAQWFPFQWGFNPAADPAKSPLPGGQLNAFELRGEYTFDFRGLEASASLGLGIERDSVGTRLAPILSPAVSIAGVVAWLGSDALGSDGTVKLVNGALSPRLIVGVDVVADFGLSPPATQATPLQKLDVRPFFEARFTDSLAIRAGLPLHAELKTRAADTTATPPVTEASDLQWSVPVFVYTALKI